MSRHTSAKNRNTKRAPSATVIAASVIAIAPAVARKTADSPPFKGGVARSAGVVGSDARSAGGAGLATADLPADYCRHTQPWPLNENDIDLPADPPPPPEPLLAAAHYVGSIHASCRDAFGLGGLDLDVMLYPPDAVEVGPLRLSREQTLKLCRLLLVAVNVGQDQGVAA